MSRETRGKQLNYLSERQFIQDERVNLVKPIPLSKNLNYYQEDLIDSEAQKEPQNKQPDTVKRPLENIVVSGFMWELSWHDPPPFSTDFYYFYFLLILILESPHVGSRR